MSDQKDSMKWPDKFRIVIVEWEDTSSQPGWHNRSETQDFVESDPCIIKSVGYLVCEDFNAVVLAQSIGETSTGDLLKIPKEVIRNHYRLADPEGDTS